ncbi:MAG TPA: tRNA pseudouridine(55) synthase TruB [Holophagaceae bacterium]|nr:tRNA pseudouridine(55) synthase TruB [Holophagaceae bacterium]
MTQASGIRCPEAGIHLVHKTVGQSSFDVVRRFKHAAYEAGHKKLALGHGGTLDPFAEGLLLVLAGQATRLMELMHPLPKTYEAEIAWGVETDTCDHLGLEVSQGDASGLTAERLEAALAPFLGWHEQVPPATSAKKIDGEAAYKKAHRGEAVVMKPSRVFLLDAAWVSHDLPRRSTLRLTCRGGFYVRSLARDLGRALGCGAHLSQLVRTAIGPWTDPGEGQEPVLQGEALIPWCPARRLTDAEHDHLQHGRAIPHGELEAPAWHLPEGFPDPGAPIRALHEGRLVALLKEEGDQLRTFANLRGGL